LRFVVKRPFEAILQQDDTLAPSELVGVAETGRARVVDSWSARLLKRQLSLPVSMLAMMGEAIEQCSRHFGVAEHCRVPSLLIG
jgi:hypothetical protein